MVGVTMASPLVQLTRASPRIFPFLVWSSTEIVALQYLLMSSFTGPVFLDAACAFGVASASTPSATTPAVAKRFILACKVRPLSAPNGRSDPGSGGRTATRTLSNVWGCAICRPPVPVGPAGGDLPACAERPPRARRKSSVARTTLPPPGGSYVLSGLLGGDPGGIERF